LENFSGDAGESDRVVSEAVEAIARAHSLIQELDERDRHIVKARFGMDNYDGKTAFHIIAKQVNLSTTRTVQRFHNSIARMRSTADAMKMTFS
jgi:DNA-directed RNA polymerase sigma subunit (sigma70/sigma32)